MTGIRVPKHGDKVVLAREVGPIYDGFDEPVLLPAGTVCAVLNRLLLPGQTLQLQLVAKGITFHVDDSGIGYAGEEGCLPVGLVEVH